MPWDAIRFVTSGLTLTAFLAVVILYAYRRRLQNREKMIALALPHERAKLVTATLEFFSMDPAVLTPKQAYELALVQIQGRAKRYQINAAIGIIIFITSATLFAFSLRNQSQQSHVAQMIHKCISSNGLGTWKDSTTGLIWTKQDSGCNLLWHEADDYCRKLTLDAHNDWRLPTIQELRAIRDLNSSIPGEWMGNNGNLVSFHVKGNLHLTGWTWSSSPTGGFEQIWHTSFGDGPFAGDNSDGITDVNNSFDSRALCVRTEN